MISVVDKLSFGVVEVVSMGYIEDNIIEFHGETFQALCSNSESYVCVNGERYDILPKTVAKFKPCSNAKEYVELVEFFAYSVLIEKSINNEGYFGKS